MELRHDPTKTFARVVALVSLFLGLLDASALLGLGLGEASPIVMLGAQGFVLLGAFSLMHLFAAVGLWIGVRWGAVVLLASLVLEIGLYLSGSGWIRLSLWSFIFKLATLLATIGLLGFSQLLARRQIAD